MKNTQRKRHTCLSGANVGYWSVSGYDMNLSLTKMLYLWSLLLLFSCSSHKINSNDVTIEQIQYNGSHDYCLVTYLHDRGASGGALYKSMLPTSQLTSNLLSGQVPTGIILKKWIDNRTVEVTYDSWLENWNNTGNKVLIDSFTNGDNIIIGEISYIVSERKHSR
jgi:hypothetical protein